MTEPPLATPTESSPHSRPPERRPPTLGPWQRLKDHKVMQWTLAYAAAAYTLLHGTEMVSNALEWPHLIVRTLTLVLILKHRCSLC